MIAAGQQSGSGRGGCHPYTPCTPPVHRRSAASRAGRITTLACLLLGLAGCDGLSGGRYRDTATAMGATSRFQADRFAGDWQVVARFGAAPVGPMAFDPASGRLSDLGSGQVYQINRPDGVAVMWVDDGFRTAALGAVDGRVGFILDRTAESAPDRLRAAREIMDFYGWDVARLTGRS